MHVKKILNYRSNIIVLVICLCIFRLLLDICYSLIISRYYGYMGFVDRHTLKSGLVSWMAFLASIPSYIRITKRKNGSSIILLFLYFLSFVPFTSCIYYDTFSIRYYVWGCLFWFVLFLFFKIILIGENKDTYRKRLLQYDNLQDILLTAIGIFSVGFTIYISARYTKFRFHFSITDVYSLRSEAQSYNLSTIAQYCMGFVRAVNPIMLSVCILQKRRLLFGVYLISALLCFGYDGSKTALFFPILFIVTTLLYRNNRQINEKKYLTVGLTVVCVLAYLEFLAFKSYLICSYLIRRVMYVENYNSFYYFDYFTNNQPDYFRSSFLRWLGFKSPYSNISKLVGLEYWHSETNANCGLGADAITNFGVIGCVLFPLMLVLVLKLFDICSNKAPRAIIVCSALYISVEIINSFLTTALLTHGILVVIIILFLLGESTDKKNGDIIKGLCDVVK